MGAIVKNMTLASFLETLYPRCVYVCVSVKPLLPALLHPSAAFQLKPRASSRRRETKNPVREAARRLLGIPLAPHYGSDGSQRSKEDVPVPRRARGETESRCSGDENNGRQTVLKRSHAVRGRMPTGRIRSGPSGGRGGASPGTARPRRQARCSFQVEMAVPRWQGRQGLQGSDRNCSHCSCRWLG